MQAFLKKATEYFNANQIEIIEKVYQFGEAMHSGQKRESGEPFFCHPISVAYTIMEMGLDYCAVCAALLHDVVEDTQATQAQLKEKFGAEITSLVEGVTNLDKIKFKSKAEEQAENFRKMFFAMSKDIRVLLIKLADRLHNMRTIKVLSEERRIAMARETIEIYAPLASRLGLSYLKCELEDLSLQILDPIEYDKLVKEVALKRAERQDLVAKLCNRLREILDELDLKGDVSGRPKHFYSIYKKMQNKNLSFEQVFDLTAIRVIVKEIRDCYEVLGTIHTIFKPIPGKFKDYIAVPKPNGYQSLHTTVMTNFGIPAEIQIRTFDMHRIAEFGIAAHWKYKENRTATEDFDEKLHWLRDVINLQNDMPSDEFLESLKVDLFSGTVFVFTPRGDVLALPEGSTPVDFAYTVHSEVGNKCIGAKINSKIVPLETKLNTGDCVDIITANNAKGPSRDWLRFVKTTSAKAKIKQFFKKQLKSENIKKGKDMLELEAKNKGYTLKQLFEPQWLETVMRRYNIQSMDDLYAAVGYGGFTVNQILFKLVAFYKKEENKRRVPDKEFVEKNRKGNCGVLIRGEDDLLIRIAKCCSPIPGDKIIGYVSKGRGVVVHRESCANLKEAESFRLIEAQWADYTPTDFFVHMRIMCNNSPDVISKVTTIVSELKLFIASMNARPDKNKKGVIDISVSVSSLSDIDLLLKKIGQLDVVDNVFRVHGK